MRRLLKQMAHPARVMVIDDDAVALELMCATLGGMSIEGFGLTDGRRVL